MMSDQQQPLPSRKLWVGLFTALYGAVIIAGIGFLSLILDRDFIVTEGSPASLRGVVAIVTAIVVFWLCMLRELQGFWTGPFLTGFAVFVMLPLAAGVGAVIESGRLGEVVFEMGELFFNPFTLTVALLAFLMALIFQVTVFLAKKRREPDTRP